jgi:WD40 repeat protein
VSDGEVKVWDEESGQLHRELGGMGVSALASFRSADGQQARLVAASGNALRIYDPEAGSLLFHLDGYANCHVELACIDSSSAAPHHPRVVSFSHDRSKVTVWDGETGEPLAELPGHMGSVHCVAVWKEPKGQHDRIVTSSGDCTVKVWDGETFALLQDLAIHSPLVLPFQSVKGPYHLLAALANEGGMQVWDPEEGRLLVDTFSGDCPLEGCHLFESAGGRYLLAMMTGSYRHPRPQGVTQDIHIDVWDLGEAPARAKPLRPAHHLG